MKYISLITLVALLFTAACEKVIQAGNTLTQEERDNLARREAEQCLTDTDGLYVKYAENTTDAMVDYERNKTWKHETKKDTTVNETSYLYVWKVAAPFIYLRFKLVENGTTTNYFIKLDTNENFDMVKKIQAIKCSKLKLHTVTHSTSSLTVNVDEPRAAEDADTESEADTDYRHISSLPPFMGTFNKKRTKRIYDEDSDTVKKTEVYDTTVTAIADVSQPATYTDASIVNRKYCMVKYTAPVAPATWNTYTFPFDLKSGCVDSDTAGPDANGDAVEDFDPITELVI